MENQTQSYPLSRSPSVMPLHAVLFLIIISAVLVITKAQWYKSYDAAKPPSYLQPPWASAPGFADAPLPVAPKPMAPPPPPPQGFQGAGRFYPPPPPPPPSPPPPLPPPPPAPGVNFPSYAPGKNTSPNLVPNSFMQLGSELEQHRVLLRGFPMTHRRLRARTAWRQPPIRTPQLSFLQLSNHNQNRVRGDG